MRDQAAVSPCGELLNAPLQRIRERAWRRLEQDPPSLAQRDATQLPIIEPLDDGLRHLAAGQDRDRDPLTLELAREIGRAALDLVDPHVVIVADMRGGADRLDAVVGGLPRHRDAVRQLSRPVVDARQDVTVEVDHLSVAQPRGRVRGERNEESR